MQAIRIFVLLACLMAGAPEAWALELTVQGDWIPSAIDSTNLQAGAGSSLNPEYESPTTQGIIDLTGTSGSGDAWRVGVKRTDVSWPAGVSISVKLRSRNPFTACFGRAMIIPSPSVWAAYPERP